MNKSLSISSLSSVRLKPQSLSWWHLTLANELDNWWNLKLISCNIKLQHSNAPLPKPSEDQRFHSCNGVIFSVMHWQSSWPSCNKHFSGFIPCVSCVSLLHNAYSALCGKCIKSIHSVSIEPRWLTNRESYEPQINRREKEREATHNNKRCVLSLFLAVVFTLAQSSWGNLGRGRETES